MISRLRKPGGKIGGLSVAAALVLGLVGVLGCVALLLSLASGSEFWSDKASNKIIGAIFFAVMLLGAFGFVIMDRAPSLGAALGVLGSAAFFLILFWAILPLLLGPVFAVVAVLRARRLRESAGTPALS